jgi:hypothetical protein
MVAAVCFWHEHHAAAVAEIKRRLEHGEQLAVAAHALAETYAVLTRLHRHVGCRPATLGR